MFGAAFPLPAAGKATGGGVPPPPPPPTAYTNGYGFRRTLHIPAGRFTASHGSFRLLVDETLTSCRSAANGGNVQNASGWDIRFESAAGAKLPHDLERYDATTGEIVAWVLIQASSTAATTFYMYYGNASVAATEANPASVWSDYLAVYHLPSTAEAGGRTARNLTSVGTVGTDTTSMIGHSMNLAGAGLLKLDGVSWLDNLAALTVQVRVKPA